MSENPIISSLLATMITAIFILTVVDFVHKNEPLPPVELKQFYKIDNELYKPVSVLGCIHLQTARKNIHAWSLCRNPIHKGNR